MSKLKEKFEKKIAPQLAEEYQIKNITAVPKIIKVVVNIGIGDAVKNKEVIKQVKEDMARITGQAPSVMGARRAVASFSIRKGMPVGLKVTLRGVRMYEFLSKLFSIVLPRLRDFRGVSIKGFDKQGNYNLGVEEHTVFPEIDLSKSQNRGLEVAIVTSTQDKKKAKRLLELLGMPFEKVKK